MNIGIYSPNWIGDAVMALPFLKCLREYFSGDHITIVCKSWVASVYRNNPDINEIIEINNRNIRSIRGTLSTIKRLRSANLDRIYLLTNSLRSALIARQAKIFERVGYTGQGRWILLSERLKLSNVTQHRSRSFCDLLHFPVDDVPLPELKVNPSNLNKAGELKDIDFDRALVVFPGSVAASRTIPPHVWTRILRFPVDEGYQVVFIGSGADWEAGEKIASSFPARTLFNLAGLYTLEESMNLISMVSGALASDSGLGHVAAALGLPTVSLFGAGDPTITAPRGMRSAWISAEVECSPCRKNVCTNKTDPLICLEKLDASVVWDRFKSL